MKKQNASLKDAGDEQKTFLTQTLFINCHEAHDPSVDRVLIGVVLPGTGFDEG